VSYFIRRAHEERTAAMRAANPNVRRSHLEMATRYDELVKAIESLARGDHIRPQRDELNLCCSCDF
jgi:hypothetical protein